MIPKYYEFNCPVKILSGRKALANLPYELTQLGAQMALVVTDKGVVGAKLIKQVEAAFKDSDREIGAIYDETPPDSSAAAVNQVARFYQEKGCDCLVAVGGGSVIDTAKGANIVISEQVDDLTELQGVDRITARMQPLVAIPTTAGTGSEVTNVAVVYDDRSGVKMGFMSNRLYPQVAILDPVMTLTLPAKMTAATGMDAYTHAVEAYYCLQKNPVSDAFATLAIKLIDQHLVQAVTDGKDTNARMGMANGALLAGIAFSNSMVGMVHALAHATGGVARVAHGVANSILLPYGMAYNLDKVPRYLAELAEIMGEPVAGLDERARAEKAIEHVKALRARLHEACGLPLTLSQAGVKEDQIEQIARVSINDGTLTYNPEEMTYDDALKVLKEAL
ncbi:MAG: iron-containing alcohol dehydrogenase [Bradymonadales bacterium]|nr:iron-containing alcohol dehydrogenase [Bradymonadales bacterium]